MYPYLNSFGHPIPMYGLLLAIGIFSASICGYMRLKQRIQGIDENNYIIIAASTFITALICAKVLYIFVSYGIVRFIKEIAHNNFNGLIEDGLVYYGGLIGGLLTAFLTVKKYKVDVSAFCDSVAPCIPLGHAFGRIGCACAGCCYGIVYNGIFAIRAKTASGDTISLFPVQILEAILNLALFAILCLFTKKRRSGLITLELYLISYCTLRFFLEFLRGDLIRGKLMLLSTSQWLSLGIILIVGLICACTYFRSAKRKLAKQ